MGEEGETCLESVLNASFNRRGLIPLRSHLVTLSKVFGFHGHPVTRDPFSSHRCPITFPKFSLLSLCFFLSSLTSFKHVAADSSLAYAFGASSWGSKSRPASATSISSSVGGRFFRMRLLLFIPQTMFVLTAPISYQRVVPI